MSAVECQLPVLPSTGGLSCSGSGDSARWLKNDFQTAVRRNLHIWVKWRTKLNDNLADAVMTGAELTGRVESFRDFLEGDAPDPGHPTSHPRTLLNFSAATTSATNLHSKEFVKYGIPRAKLDPRQEQEMARRSHAADDGSASTIDVAQSGSDAARRGTIYTSSARPVFTPPPHKKIQFSPQTASKLRALNLFGRDNKLQVKGEK